MTDELREKCIQVLSKYFPDEPLLFMEDPVDAILSLAIPAIREECVRVAEAVPERFLHTYQRGPDAPPGNQWIDTKPLHVADCIRALGEKQG